MPEHQVRVAILWCDDLEARGKPMPKESRLFSVHTALASLGISVESVVYANAFAEEVREQLFDPDLDCVLVWADPIRGDDNRIVLDSLLREVADHGVLVSAHPDTILKMATKEVLYRTRELSWGTDTHLYRTFSEFKDEFPARLARGQTRVIKQHRGNDGIGVWKVELIAGAPSDLSGASTKVDATVRVQHAASKSDATEDLRLSSFVARCANFFANSGRIIDQAYVERAAKGMIRTYFVNDEVVGFAHQSPADPSVDSAAPPPDKVFGFPSAKTMYGPNEPLFHDLKTSLDSEWVPGLKRLVGVGEKDLPLLWDCDFLYGPKTGIGNDTYILCEINASNVTPFPDSVPVKLAEAVLSHMESRDRSGGLG